MYCRLRYNLKVVAAENYMSSAVAIFFCFFIMLSYAVFMFFHSNSHFFMKSVPFFWKKV